MKTISTLWPTLDPAVRQWLLHNPGSLVLPRTLVNRVESTTGEVLSTDAHGEHRLTGDELVFLRARHRAEMLLGRSASPSGTSGQPGVPVEALDR
ncbi:hypothetical protein FJV46_13255 [Arthrobacter agilis]|uniref:hypothetical protein n=1 Tax=Arthrobacter agilis TaxID=37921 RepID=UPI000B35D243|nr:hypothetical protein [Arthrobacter agilis]OUM44450.1 hypothetical protein B8W74_03025 [Arthrobacter agilis]PPB47354.1 hypothetical protein CI784_01990 [Arthrobacter agilis]TPV22856.1 hypothetical protein FJV46_13255 [Arthrobacter agilis]WDF31855.1 hypothetical protein PTW37_08065 [Arthrobacter agilis]VDR32109.1 Uncharacterised protein [Arthrobacter agilis]